MIFGISRNQTNHFRESIRVCRFIPGLSIESFGSDVSSTYYYFISNNSGRHFAMGIFCSDLNWNIGLRH